MRIGIILHPYGEAKPGGLARTIFEWTNALIRQAPEHEYVLFLKHAPESPPHVSGANIRIEVLPKRLLWLDGLRSATLCDAYLFQTSVLPMFFRPKRSVVIVQDFPYRYLAAQSFTDWLRHIAIRFVHRRSFRRIDRIVAVSESTKQDTIRFYRVSEQKIAVIPMGFKSICAVSEEAVSAPEKFFLYAGVVKERKNVLRIAEAFHLFKKRHPELPYQLMIAGKAEGAYADRVVAYLRSCGRERDTAFLGFMNDGQLSYLYRRAEALVFPSIVEGFGFPVLEAMDCGTPVITSDAFGPAETGRGGVAVLVNPWSAAEIAAAMERVAIDAAFRAELVERGRARAKEFSWNKAADALLAVLMKP